MVGMRGGTRGGILLRWRLKLRGLGDGGVLGEFVGERQPYGTGTRGPHNSAAFGILVPGGQGCYQHARIQDGERGAREGLIAKAAIAMRATRSATIAQMVRDIGADALVHIDALDAAAGLACPRRKSCGGQGP
jgi:hypothetical protein